MSRLIFLFSFIASISLYAGDNEKSKEAKTIVYIEGSVVDIHNGQALTGVCVKLEGPSRKTYTDFEGNFSFKNISAGEYRIISEYISYKTKVTVIEPEDDRQMVISLESL